MTNSVTFFVLRMFSGCTVDKQKKRSGMYKLQCFWFGRYTGWGTLKNKCFHHLENIIFSGSKYLNSILVNF